MLGPILKALPGDYPWTNRIHYYEELPSTNDLAKSLARQGAPHGTAILARSQTAGRGRLGRSFHSAAGAGIYLSLILRPQCPPAALMHLTCATAVAVCDGVEAATGLRPGIKWINDLVWQKKKLGGILTELVLSPRGELEAAVLGIGLNCSQASGDFPPELQPIACSLATALGAAPDAAGVAAAILAALAGISTDLLAQKDRILGRYRRDCITLGREVQLVGRDTQALALDVDDDGALLVRLPDGSIRAVNSGEVSVRGIFGYLD